MAANRVVRVAILGDAKDFNRAVGSANASAGKLASIGKTAAIGIAAVGGAAVAAGVGLFKLGESFDAQYDKIRVGTGATGEALKGLEQSFKNVLQTGPDSMDLVGTAIADLNTRLGLTGPELEDLSRQFLDLSRITETDLAANVDNLTRVFGDWGIVAGDMPFTLDQIYRASQASGISLDELSTSVVQFGAPLRNLGFKFDESLALLAQFNKTGVNTQTVFAGLKAGVGKLAKAGEDVPTTFRRIVREIREMGPGTKATRLAIELFGQRAGPDLADAIAGGKFELEDMLATISGGEDTILGAAEDTADFSEKWNTFKNKVLVALEPIAMRVFDALGDAMDRLGLWWDQNGDGIITWVRDTAAALEENLGPAVRAVGKWIFEELLPRLKSVVEWAVNSKPLLLTLAGVVGTTLVAAFLGWAASAVAATVATLAAVWPVLLLAGATAALTAGTQFLIDKFDLLPKASKAFQFVLRYGIVPLITQIERAIAAVARLKAGLDAIGGKVTELIPGRAKGGDIDFIKGLDGHAQGGVVAGAFGQPRMILAHGGERVLTHGEQLRAGGMGVGFPSHVTLVVDGQQFSARLYADGKARAGRRGVSV